VGLLTGDALDAPPDTWRFCAAGAAAARREARARQDPAYAGPLRRAGRVAARGRALKSAATRLAMRGPAGPLLTARPRFADCGSQGLRYAQPTRHLARTTPTSGAGLKNPCSAAQSTTPVTYDHPRSPAFGVAIKLPSGKVSSQHGLIRLQDLLPTLGECLRQLSGRALPPERLSRSYAFQPPR